jgi:hypothetical protein
MSHRMFLWFAAYTAICASSVLASAQVTSSPTEIMRPQATTGLVAYIYVSSLVSGSGEEGGIFLDRGRASSSTEQIIS